MPLAGLCRMAFQIDGFLRTSHAAVRNNQRASSQASSLSSGRNLPGRVSGAATMDSAFSFRRSEARRVGKGCVSRGESRWSWYNKQKERNHDIHYNTILFT